MRRCVAVLVARHLDAYIAMKLSTGTIRGVFPFMLFDQ